MRMESSFAPTVVHFLRSEARPLPRLPLLLLALGLPLAGTAAPAAPSIPLPANAKRASIANRTTPPEGIARVDWNGIRDAHVAWRHRFQRNGDGHFSARNPGQQWDTTFDGRGFLTRPDHGNWEWGLEILRYGIGENLVSVDKETEGGTVGPTKGDGKDRLAFRRDARLEEWFRNDTRGLEQGWTLSERPMRAPREAGTGEEKLGIDLAVRGGLRPEILGDGRAVRFVDDTGTPALTYGGLKAWDAEGQVLETRFVPGTGSVDSGGIRIEVDERDAVYPVTIDPVAQQAYLKASNTDSTDHFGWDMDMDGDTVVISANQEDSDSIGVNNDGSNDNASNSGAVYVFVRNGGTWSQQAYLKASNTEAIDSFGYSVSVDGDTIVVGAFREDSDSTGVNNDGSNNDAVNSGAAYVFVRNGTTWSQQAYLKASNTETGDQFGLSVAVSGDFALIGAYLEDSAATGVNGLEGDNTADGSGAAYLFERSGTTWTQAAYLKASNTDADDGFGWSVSVSGTSAVIGAYGESSGADGVNGDESDDSASSAGAAYVFVRNGGVWTQQAYLKASNSEAQDNFGGAAAIDGDTVVVAAHTEDSDATGVNGNDNDNSGNSGAVYVFARSGTTWSQQAYLKASNTELSDQFGGSVAVDGDIVVVGASNEDSAATGVDGDGSDNSTENAGAAYLFERIGTNWFPLAYLKAPATSENDNFGGSVATSGNLVAVGGYREDSNATGVDGDSNNDITPDSGAAYIFEIPLPVTAPPAPAPDITGPALSFKKKRKLKKPRSRHKIKGLVTDDSTVVRVEVKSRLHRGWKKAKLKTVGQWTYRTPRLDPGRNAFKVRAVDSSGNFSKVERVKATGK